MKTLLACLVASTALATEIATPPYGILVNEDSADRFDFTVTRFDPEGSDFQLVVGEGGSSIALLAAPGMQVIISPWWSAGWEGSQFMVAAPFGAADVIDFTGSQVIEVVPPPGGFPALRFVYGLPLEPSTDQDGDGIPDDQDGCPGSILTPTVQIGGCDTGVANTVDGSGCTLADRVIPAVEAAAAGARNHGRYVSAVARYLNGLVAEGVIGLEDHEAIMSCVARKAGRGR